QFYSFFFFSCSLALHDVHSFPTRRSSDLRRGLRLLDGRRAAGAPFPSPFPKARYRFRASLPYSRCARSVESTRTTFRQMKPKRKDRKSTRLNSSHVSISYAVFCLKKKKKK